MSRGGTLRAIIISAGAGSRLGSYTEALPKCLVEVGGRAIVDHQLDALVAAGVETATIVGGYRYDVLAAHLAARSAAPTVDLLRNPFWAVAGAIGSVWTARAHLDEPFLLMNGDTLFDPAILKAAIKNAAAGVSLVVEPLSTPALDDMLVEVRDGRVRDVAKTLAAQGTHRSLGIILSTGGGEYAHALDDVIASENGIHAYHHDVVARLARSDRVAAAIAATGAHWQEIDRPEDLAQWARDHGHRDDGPA